MESHVHVRVPARVSPSSRMLRCRQYCLLVVLVPGGILAPLMIDRAMLALFAGAQREISSRSDESSRQDAADMSIDVPIWTCGSKEVATVLAHVDWTVRRVKEDLFQRFMVGADQQILVCCGKVLDENTAIVDLITQLQHEEKVWVVFRNVWRASLIRSKEDPLLPLLHSVFASGFSRPASAVCMDQCRKTFEEFCKSHRTMRQEKIGTSGESRYSVSELTWKPNEEEQTRLAASVQALRNEFGCTNYPQVKWFPEYGCALLVSSIDVTRLSLQVHLHLHVFHLPPLLTRVFADSTVLSYLCTDYWTRRMGLHDSPSCTSARVQFDTTIIGRQDTAHCRNRPTFVRHICVSRVLFPQEGAREERRGKECSTQRARPPEDTCYDHGGSDRLSEIHAFDGRKARGNGLDKPQRRFHGCWGPYRGLCPRYRLVHSRSCGGDSAGRPPSLQSVDGPDTYLAD